MKTASSARTISCIRRAGSDHGDPKRFTMWGRTCDPEPEHEAAAGDELQVVAEVGEVHRVAGERDRDRGPELHARGVLGGDGERDERIVLGLEREDAVVPDLLEARVRRAHVARILERAGGEDLHAPGQASCSMAMRRRPASIEREVGERLREVAEVLAGGRVDLLGVQVQRTRERQELLEERSGPLGLADDRERGDQPERADGERALLAGQAVVGACRRGSAAPSPSLVSSSAMARTVARTRSSSPGRKPMIGMSRFDASRALVP